ncbi:2-oxoglutarate dehydrogenase E1 component [Muricoccus radiodurans]|uniref:2-oxoglutarate dehydrogenase E1 component n=1 Tax=Muricoccus radiodurans TaxID=2231721 RepID=UPI003CE8EE80
MSVRSSPLLAMGIGNLEDLQRRYRDDPGSVDVSWRLLFEVLDEIGDGTFRPSPVDGTAAAEVLLSEAIRARGHRIAALDPLADTHAAPDPGRLREHVPTTSGDPERLAALYGGSLTVETAHIDDPTARAWLRAEFERTQPPNGVADPRQMLQSLLEADEFERFLSVKHPTKKRFGAEGAEAIVPLLRRLLSQAAASGVTHVVIGTMHRGRLSIMANVLGKSLVAMMREIKGGHPFPADTPRAADVPYHLGLETTLDLDGHPLRISLLANPSHLEAVNPLVLGRARALQDLEGPEGRTKVLPVILHTDAAVIGQGIVAETLQLGGTPGFGTGGTLHVVINNRIGFTTEEREARTATHCTGAWKAIDAAILHVNAEDPEAACRAADLAFEYRRTQARDAVIDLVCYRRNGHNEIDEPGFTQPLLYEAVSRKQPVAERFARRLVEAGTMAEAEVTEARARIRERLQRAYEEAPAHRPNRSGYPDGRRARPGAPADPETGIATATLSALSTRWARPPEGATLHPRIGRVLRQRAVAEDGTVNWPNAEALAFATLLTGGTPVRLTGQDVVRGAFSHRHFGLVDTANGRIHLGLDTLSADQARFSAFNSPLSEYAVLGFEYGYSLERPEALTIWEAQFGDFANGAQIVIDQFVTAAEEKWCDASGLVMLLPHGLEGQGPEHSSARIERYLQMAAKDNIRVVQPSTPANYFHLLRRQALAQDRRPLVVMSPKKLLRLPAAVSPLADFAPGRRFRPVIGPAEEIAADLVLLCSGKIAYELEEERARRGAARVAILRIEELYPFPEEELTALFRHWPAARFRWVQEEPENMGAWIWLDRRLERALTKSGVARPRVDYVGRPESPSPAGSFHDDHEADQRRIVEAAFSP